MDSSTQKVVIIDYQMSNLFSVVHACEHAGIPAVISSSPRDVAAADALILPGVGAFKDAMDNLKRLDLIGPIQDAIAGGKSFFGICLGLQLLFEGSEEFGGSEGLGVLPGTVVRFPARDEDGNTIRVPHIGWNRIRKPRGRAWTETPLATTEPDAFMYFVHSYHVAPSSNDSILATTDYCGVEFCCAVGRDNIFATQFHPEKSGAKGLELYTNWMYQSVQQG